ncbi:glycosyltransferase family 69 protein [Amniculicola lignicola CBS 123094]|uniref:Glycosyltransferase family 69 protein n=1 Tax=Amniculicola lignicola CBS 123094 TaxID=1392246 RepID=A0A6A5WNK4_9PLEO|nr:glycosyltransferase family 69 protein [Amniculicola lignicola CBS 123094]
MSSRFSRPAHEYELLPRASLEAEDFPELQRHTSNSSWLSRVAESLPFGVKQISNPSTYAHYITPRRKKRSIIRLIIYSVVSIPYILLSLVLIVGAFFPSYTYRPAHYSELRQRSLESAVPGRANIHNEKVFIAASLYEPNGTLTSGAWGQSVLDLVDLLGPENVYLSIYENSPDAGTVASLDRFRQRVTCNSSIVYEDLDLATLPRITLPNGETRLRRIAFLAEVRNRALTPIDTAGVAFDRILYINDVNFDPIDAAQLLLSTNVDASGRANYGAACAVDFINPFKFYDRFATRDIDGYNMGIPFYPWFTSAGSATSRSDVIAGTDAVRVRSCWGGMAAFEAKWFQDFTKLNDPSPPPNNTQLATPPAPTDPNEVLAKTPLRFRVEQENFWEASECCLINADLTYLRTGHALPADAGIYMNPYIRVAYSPTVLSWLSLTRRPERLYSLVHDILNHAVNFPNYNPRQGEEPGKKIREGVWKYDDPARAFLPNATVADRQGQWVDEERVSHVGGFCGGRFLLVMNDDAKEGESKWGKILAPSPPPGS